MQGELDGWKEQAKKIDPATGAIIFAFKTFLEPLSELKKEGCGKQLADALDGLRMAVCRLWTFMRTVLFGGSTWWSILPCDDLLHESK